MMITHTKSGVKIGTEDEAELTAGSMMGRSFQHLIDAFEIETGEKVQAVRVNMDYGLMFILK